MKKEKIDFEYIDSIIETVLSESISEIYDTISQYASTIEERAYYYSKLNNISIQTKQVNILKKYIIKNYSEILENSTLDSILELLEKDTEFQNILNNILYEAYENSKIKKREILEFLKFLKND